jgi:hypothetical protein
MPKFVIQMKKGKETPGTWVYTAPKTDAEGKPVAATSIYLSKESLGKEVPEQVKVTIEA